MDFPSQSFECNNPVQYNYSAHLFIQKSLHFIFLSGSANQKHDAIMLNKFGF